MGKASETSATPSLSSSESSISGMPSLSLSGASAATAIFSNNLTAPASSAKLSTVIDSETTSKTEACNEPCAATTISVAISDNGSRVISATTALTIATASATAFTADEATFILGVIS